MVTVAHTSSDLCYLMPGPQNVYEMTAPSPQKRAQQTMMFHPSGVQVGVHGPSRLHVMGPIGPPWMPRWHP